MDEFCGSRFWNTETVWNTDDPDFTICFEKTVLVLIPCAFLWILLPFEIYLLRCSKCFDIPWNAYNIVKLLAITVLAATSLAEIVTNVLFSDSYFLVDLYSPLLKFITLLLFFGLTYANMKFGRRSSGILFIFSVLSAFFGAFQCRTEIRLRWSQINDVKSQVVPFTPYPIYYLVVAFVFVMNCFADSRPRITPQSYDKNACPRKQSSFLSRIFFAWFEPLIWKGYKKSLKDEDLWTLDESISSSNVVPRFEKHWNKSWENIKKSANLSTENRSKCGYKFNENKKVSIVPALFRTFGFTFILTMLMKVFLDLYVLVHPGLLSALIDFIGSDEPMWKGYAYAIALFLAAVFETLMSSQYYFIMYTIGLQIRACLISIIYKKALRISNGARKKFTVGETVNLMSVDAYRFVDLFLLSFLFFSTPLQVILVAYFLWQILGPSIMAGLVMIIISIFANSYAASKVESLQLKQMKKKDERALLLNQVISGIKVLKLYAWEPSFEKQVVSIRNEEIKILKKQAYLNSFLALIGGCTTFLIPLVTFAVFLFSSEKNVLSAKVAFVSISLFNLLRFSMVRMPQIISNFSQASVSVKRINRFLNSEDLNFDDISHEKRSEPLVIENGSFSWEGSRGTPILRHINLKINRGALVAVVGPVGCGKSSLILAFLGELYKLSGTVNTTGSIAYVPQQAWIRNATVRDNITFGEPIDSSYYDEVLEACALKPDLKILPAGDSTEIGEKGVNLSGGQKQRLSMARAIYIRADVYLLDDPLSAVDSHVGKHIFEHVIGPNGLLKNKTRVLVTHSVTYLSQVDLIVVMKDGSITESGTFDELLDNKGNFSEYLIHYLEENKECAEEDFDKLVHTLEEKNLSSEKLVRQRSIRSESGSFGSSFRRESKRDKTRGPLKQQISPKETVTGEKLIEEEHSDTGNINRDVFAYFLRSAGIVVGFFILLTGILSESFYLMSNIWLSKWTADPETTTSEGTQNIAETNYYLLIYTLLGLGKGLADCLTDFANRIACWNSAKIFHNSMLSNLFRVPLSFMDVTPGGRILSRFSKDIDVVDSTLPNQIPSMCLNFLETIGTIIIVSYSTPAFIPVLIPIVALFCLFQRFYTATSRQLKRLESVSRSPIYSHFLETFVGSHSIRAYGLSEKFIRQSEEKVDLNHKSYYLNIVSIKWLSIRLEIICDVITFLAALLAVLNRGSISPGVAGLSVGSTLQIAIALYWMVYMLSETETNIVSIERMKEFIEIPREAAWQIPEEEVPLNWPSKGEITFLDFKVRYREGLQLVLKGISFCVNGAQKVGIVGRTGAGKSSLTLSLFRILESAGGQILIDGVDIATLGLHTVRSKLTIIPQDPVVFAGSLRINLDPFGEHSDNNIWRALELAHLKSYISSLEGGLDYEVTEGGENLSVGQRQLICLARALLRKTKILILDEATAAVDLETDDLIQSTIREEFKDCTVLTIAHRLNTIMDYDKILVLDQGYVAEYDSPQNLLESRNSLFYGMAIDAGLV